MDSFDDKSLSERLSALSEFNRSSLLDWADKDTQFRRKLIEELRERCTGNDKQPGDTALLQWAILREQCSDIVTSSLDPLPKITD